MADVTYVRITNSSDTVISGETGTWIPVSDLDLQTTYNSGSDPNFTLSFGLSNDDAIANKLNANVNSNGPLQIEVVTYDTSTATARSPGTLFSYTVSSKAYVTGQSQAGGVPAGTGATSTANYQLALGNISQTTYPPGAPPSSSAYAAGQGDVAPTPTPAEVVSGSSVATSTSTAPVGSGLTYYARFVGVSGIDSNTFYAIDDVASGITRPVTFGANGRPEVSSAQLDAVSMRIDNLQTVDLPLFAANLGTDTFGLQIEAVTTSGGVTRVVDNTTYSGVLVNNADTKGNYAFVYTGSLTQHLDAAGNVISAFGRNAPTSLYPPVVPQSPVGPGQPLSSDTLIFDGSSGMTGDPSSAITGVYFSIGHGIATATGRGDASVSEMTFATGSQKLALTIDQDILTEQTGKSATVDQAIAGTNGRLAIQRSYVLGNVLISRDRISLISGQRAASFNFTRVEDRTAPGGTPQSYSGADPSAPTSTTNTAYVEFRDPTTGAVVTSSTGQQWFKLDTAEMTIGRPIGTAPDGSRTLAPPDFGALGFSIGQNAITATLDTDIVGGKALTAEVASYDANGAIQSDYVFGSGVLNAHTNATSPDSQAFTFTNTSAFQETQYDSSGASIGSFNYYTSTGHSGDALASNAGAKAPTAPTGPSVLDTYVQFVGSNGAPLTDAGGASWFKVAGTVSALSQVNGATQLGDLGLSLGNTDVATQLHADQFGGIGLGRINVTSYDSSGNLVSYQRYTGVTVGAPGADTTIDNGGGDNGLSFAYTGYGELVSGTNPLNPSTASAGSNPSVPTTLIQDPLTSDQATPEPTVTAPPSLSQLSYVAEMKLRGSDVFAGTPSGFVATPGFSIDISGKTATFEVDQAQAAALSQALYSQPDADFRNRNESLEITGYGSNGNPSVDYLMSGVVLTSTGLDTATGLETVKLSYANIQETALCFARGTRIATRRGDVAVEDLVVGDLAVTHDGRTRPIRWLAHRAIDCAAAPVPSEVWPVSIAAGAFGRGLPARDLRLSPGHPVLVGADDEGAGGHLVPIMCLVNGTTVERVRTGSVEYWHVELDAHDILLAEGLPAESYIDLGSRAWFDGACGVFFDPDLALAGMPGRCRPVATHGSVVEAERRRLDARFAARLAAAAAWPDDGRLVDAAHA